MEHGKGSRRREAKVVMEKEVGVRDREGEVGSRRRRKKMERLRYLKSGGEKKDEEGEDGAGSEERDVRKRSTRHENVG